MSSVSRRELIRVGAATGAGVIVLLAAEAFGRTEAFLAEAGLAGHVVRPSDPSYDRARVGWDCLFTHYPLAITFCRGEREVVSALRWARRHDVAIQARSGRHSLAGWSNLDQGLVIDVQPHEAGED
jgi:FAD/FMN-containing dehydrogenase